VGNWLRLRKSENEGSLRRRKDGSATLGSVVNCWRWCLKFWRPWCW